MNLKGLGRRGEEREEHISEAGIRTYSRGLSKSTQGFEDTLYEYSDS